ncbi:MAG: PRTRC system ThiF family protein [Puia sp.]|nr:PRTRC system ThiF family protein [Puia sp.]
MNAHTQQIQPPPPISTLPAVHFVDPYLLNPTNPITVNVIGAGGTGSHVMTVLGALEEALRAWGHPGLQVTAFDDDEITVSNMGRQAFFRSEIGQNKAVAIVTRINRHIGTRWQASKLRWKKTNKEALRGAVRANLTISCVDRPETRFDIETLLGRPGGGHGPDNPLYWIDFGNSRYTGQVLLSTRRDIKQPPLEGYHGVGYLPSVTRQYEDLLYAATDSDEPSCSMLEALNRQSLFINRSLASVGGMLLENLFRQSILDSKGFFLNLSDGVMRPIPIG